jgi:hypothetical protein
LLLASLISIDTCLRHPQPTRNGGNDFSSMIAANCDRILSGQTVPSNWPVEGWAELAVSHVLRSRIAIMLAFAKFPPVLAWLLGGLTLEREYLTKIRPMAQRLPYYA